MKPYEILIEKIAYPGFDILTGSMLTKYLKYLRLNDKLDYIDMKALQLAKLKKILDFANSNLERYKTVEYSEDPIQYLKNFPLMDRSTLKKGAIDNLIPNYDKNGTYYSSGGSTSEIAYAYLSNKEYSYCQATQLYWLGKLGHKPGDKIIQTAVKKSKRLNTRKIKDFLLNTAYIFYYDLTEKEKISFLRNYSKHKNMFFIGFPTILLDMLELCRKNSIPLKFKGILSFGEALTEETHKMLSDFFNAEVYNTYGSREGALIAAGPESGMLPIVMENVYVEIIDDNGNEVPIGQLGHILVTNLNTYNMPLIRYKIGDIGSLVPASEFCKRDMMENIIGRDNDFIITPDGLKFTYFAVHEYDEVLRYKVRMYQWHQKTQNLIQVNYVPSDKGLLTDEEKINYVKLAHEKFHTDMIDIEFKVVDDLTKFKSGKIQRVINDLIRDKSDLIES